MGDKDKVQVTLDTETANKLSEALRQATEPPPARYPDPADLPNSKNKEGRQTFIDW